MAKWLYTTLAAFFTILAAEVSVAQDTSNFVVAFRKDAPPFSSQVEDTSGELVFSGFVVDICENAFKQINIATRIAREPVEALSRFTVFEDKKAAILCGPVSITSSRLTEFIFSFPIFVSGISYATSISSSSIGGDPSSKRAAVLRNSTTFTDSTGPLFEQSFGEAGVNIFSDILRLRDWSDVNEPSLNNVILVDGYEDGFNALCNSEVSYLLGDVDILNGFVRNDGLPDACRGQDVFVEPRTISRELYGIVFSPTFLRSDEGLSIFAEFQKSIFDQFQDGRAQRAFRENFPGDVKMSSELEKMFSTYQRDLFPK